MVVPLIGSESLLLSASIKDSNQAKSSKWNCSNTGTRFVKDGWGAGVVRPKLRLSIPISMSIKITKLQQGFKERIKINKQKN